LSYVSSFKGLRDLFTNQLALELVASLLPVENAARIAPYMRIAVTHQVLVGRDTGDTIIAGTVDDNLIVLGKLCQRFLRRGKVQRARDVLGAYCQSPNAITS
jgi:hypothetical protein